MKESLVDISRQLQEALSRESLMQKSKVKVQNKVTVEELKTMTEHFRCVTELIWLFVRTVAPNCPL